jgi:hypothetical protein
MRLKDRLRYFETDRGHEDGWTVEVDGVPVAELVDATYIRPFWRRFRVVNLSSDQAVQSALHTAEFWKRRNIVYRNRRIDLIVELLLVRLDTEPGHIVHLGSYGPDVPSVPTSMELTLLATRRAARAAARIAEPPRTDGLPDVTPELRRQLLISDHGHDFGWIVERDGVALATMTNGRPFEMFWREWTLEPLEGGESLREALFTDTFWQDAQLTYRNRKLDVLATAFLVRAGPQFGDKVVQRGGMFWPDPWPTLADRAASLRQRLRGHD